MGDDDARGIGRRRLLLYTLAGTTTVAAGFVGYRRWERHREEAILAGIDQPGFRSPTGTVTRRRRLGRTNLDVAPIGIGAGGLDSTAPVHRAVEKGINYIDTSACYGHGASENVLGRAFRESPSLRGKVVLATKWDAGAKMPKERMLESLDESLKRMGTDHVDVMLIHQLGDHLGPSDDGFSRLDNPELYAAMEIAKKAGKARFFGASGHTGNRTAILSHAIDKGVFDMILVKMNVLDYTEADMPRLLAKAKEKDVGVVVMKSQPNGGMMPKGFEKSKWNVYQANLRWCLQKDIACVVHTGIGNNPDMQDMAIGAVHDEVTMDEREERELLERYALALSPHYCRGCAGECTSKCPSAIAIPSVLRAVMYERHYRDHALATDTYRALPAANRWSETCLACTKCDEACPYGVDASARVREAKALLA
jgi:predicted aldo/keto reductase-like oxidoreductase